MGIRYPGRAAIDPSAPEAVGVCDRCGQLYNLRDLRYQPVIAGTSTLITRLRVCTVTCLDELNEQERVVRVPPDPMPVSDPRVENFAVDEKNFLQLTAYVGQQHMFQTVGAMGCELTLVSQGTPIVADFGAVGVADAVLTRGRHIAAAVDAVGSVDAVLKYTAQIAADFGAVGSVDAVLTQAAGGLATISLFASDTEIDLPSITAPASIAAGDVIVFLNWARDVGLPTTAIPSGFTSISNVSLTNARVILSYKLAVGGEGGSTLTGMTSGTDDLVIIVLVFRGNVPATSATVQDAAGEMINTAPSDQVVNASGGNPPLIVLGGFASTGAFTPGFSPSADATFSDTSSTGPQLDLAYKIYDSSPADVTMSKTDTGNRNTIVSCYIEMSS